MVLAGLGFYQKEYLYFLSGFLDLGKYILVSLSLMNLPAQQGVKQSPAIAG
jgi:hypothetical protein